MKAAVYTQNGSPDVLNLAEVEKPVPGERQVLVKVYAASVNALDLHLMRGMPGSATARRKPVQVIPGVDVAGRVEAVGKSVTQFRPGDEVFGRGAGTFAEYALAREDMLAPKPDNVPFESAAAVPIAGLTALQGLRDKGRIQAGQEVLINGASGGVGTFAVQMARAFGASVTAVCSPRNLEMARSIGAVEVIDYTREDFTRSGRLYDLILSANGYHPLADYRRALKPGGIYVMAGGVKERYPQAMLQIALAKVLLPKGQKHRFAFFLAKIRQSDLFAIGDLLAAGKVVPVIDRCYALEETRAALRYVNDEHARGKVVIVP